MVVVTGMWAALCLFSLTLAAEPNTDLCLGTPYYITPASSATSFPLGQHVSGKRRRFDDSCYEKDSFESEQVAESCTPVWPHPKRARSIVGPGCVFCGRRFSYPPDLQYHFQMQTNVCFKIQRKLLGPGMTAAQVQYDPSAYIASAQTLRADFHGLGKIRCLICNALLSQKAVRNHYSADACIEVRKQRFIQTQRNANALVHCPYCHIPVYQLLLRGHLATSKACNVEEKNLIRIESQEQAAMLGGHLYQFL
jgi:hypothetical protein